MLRHQTLENLYSNCMDIENMRLLVRESIYWLNMNIQNAVKIAQYTWSLNRHSHRTKMIPLQIPGISWVVAVTDLFNPYI